MTQKRLVRLAELTSLKPVAKGPWQNPAAVGSMQGYPVAAAWSRNQNHSQVSFLVRFAKGSWSAGPDGLAAFAAGSEDLRQATGKKAVPKALLKSLTLMEDGIVCHWPFSLFAPKPEAVAGVLKVLVGFAAKAAKPVAEQCESCGRETREGLWTADGVPVRICTPCRASQDEQARRAKEAYDGLVSNPMAGLLYGAVTGAVLAVLWGGLAYLIHRIFLWGAIGIGVALAWAINRGMEKVNHVGRALTVLLTVVTVLAGDYLFILFSAAREVEGGLSLRLALLAAQHFFEADFQEGSGYVSLLFALIGAGYILYVNRPPRFQVKYEPLS
ncbi:hypothetical protein [Geothrix terrae]|uniref:hypothetical protein n=1 Tax=Geothrix terrae TaxID=2922720 RepID=UPI001FACFF0D|nr:hypothetical protein [Geothrix terrae]